MTRILIVDDVQDERNVIRYLLNKFDFDFDIHEANNGKEALSYLKENIVDILFTDVKMPFMDGIELTGKAKQLYPDIQVIFFSGHDDFDFIKKALSYQAVDYILKPLNPIEFQQTILSVLHNIEKQKKESTLQQIGYESLKNHILNRLINKTPLSILKNEYPLMDFSFIRHYHFLMLVEFIDPFFDRLPENEDTLSFYRQLKKTIPDCSFDFINLNPFQALLLFNKRDYTCPSEYVKTAKKLQVHVLSEYGLNCYVSISRELKTVEDLPILFDELEKHLKDRFYYPNAYIYPISLFVQENTEHLEEDEQHFQAIKMAIENIDAAAFEKNMNQLIHKYRNKQQISLVYMRFFFSRLVQMLCKTLSLEKKSIECITETIHSNKHFSDIEGILLNLQNKMIQLLEAEGHSQKHVVQVIQQYIDEHFAEDLSLNVLAEKVYLSPGYVSELFIQETGSGINKYIKNLRMENAKTLLQETNMRVIDIGKSVGYLNPSYFSRTFREYFGTSPDKYREMHRIRNQ